MKKSNDSLNDFVELVGKTSSTVKDNIDESLKKNGYDSVSDLVSDGIDKAFGNKNQLKPYSVHSRSIVDSKYSYMKKIMSEISYGRRNLGYYKDGYELVINKYKTKLETYKNKLDLFETELRHDFKIIKNTNNDKHQQAQKDALEYLLTELDYCKKQLMLKIKMELLK